MEHFPEIRALILHDNDDDDENGDGDVSVNLLDNGDENGDGDVTVNLPDKVPLVIQWSSRISKEYNPNTRYRDNALFDAFQDDNVIWVPYVRLRRDDLPTDFRYQLTMGRRDTIVVCYECATWHSPSSCPQQMGLAFALDINRRVINQASKKGPKGKDFSTFKDYPIYLGIWREAQALEEEVQVQAREEGQAYAQEEAQPQAQEELGPTGGDSMDFSLAVDEAEEDASQSLFPMDVNDFDDGDSMDFSLAVSEAEEDASQSLCPIDVNDFDGVFWCFFSFLDSCFNFPAIKLLCFCFFPLSDAVQ